MCIFLGSMPPYVNSQPSRITMVLEQLGHQIPLAMWYTGLLTIPEEYIVKLADMELIMMVQ